MVYEADKPETKRLKRDGAMIFEFERRDCFHQLEDYLKTGSTRVCILYGLRRTGKTTMMFQAISDIEPENAGYILCEDGDGYGGQEKKDSIPDAATVTSDIKTEKTAPGTSDIAKSRIKRRRGSGGKQR